VETRFSENVLHLRPDWDELWLAKAALSALRSTCPRKQVGAVIVSEYQRILSDGYNAKPASAPNCWDSPCYSQASHEEGRALCEAVHAEMNALSMVNGAGDKPHTVYVTLQPCKHCAKVITSYPSIKRVVFRDAYHNTDGVAHLQKFGIDVIHIPRARLQAVVRLLLEKQID
jgi:dCMP deaminase